MIELTRINGQTFLLNVLLIEQIEAFPDTTVTLVNGKKIVLQNDLVEVKQLVNEQLKQIGLVGMRRDAGGS